jgi:hypothetical protein
MGSGREGERTIGKGGRGRQTRESRRKESEEGSEREGAAFVSIRARAVSTFQFKRCV